jgi:hypothetical protein
VERPCSQLQSFTHLTLSNYQLLPIRPLHQFFCRLVVTGQNH